MGTIRNALTGMIVLLAIAGIACNGAGHASGSAGNTRASVYCSEVFAGGDVTCSIQARGGGPRTYSVCWDIIRNCAGGRRATDNTCKDVAGEGKASLVFSSRKFTGGTCNVTGLAVDNVQVVTR